jgi:hypothetical protein
MAGETVDLDTKSRANLLERRESRKSFDEQLAEAIERIYRAYGSNLTAFFRDAGCKF